MISMSSPPIAVDVYLGSPESQVSPYMYICRARGNRMFVSSGLLILLGNPQETLRSMILTVVTWTKTE